MELLGEALAADDGPSAAGWYFRAAKLGNIAAKTKLIELANSISVK
jgi:hypothetical protein